MKAIMMAVLAVTSACTKSNVNLTQQQVQQQVTGQWKVTYFFDDKDETSHFSGYAFDFQGDGTLVATHASKGTFTGSWSNQDNSSDHGPKLIITIAGNYEMDELNEDWEIMELSDKKMHLRDDNKTKIEEVRFEKM
jgi:hypothetical protein